MAAKKETISNWFSNGVRGKQDYMIVVCDTFDQEDYPVYCKKKEFWDKYKSHDGKGMQKIMEVYDLHKDKEEQLNETLVNNCPPKVD
jgi:hypothetical protein